MIKDVMVFLDGGKADEFRIAAAAGIAKRFDCHIVGLFLNPLPTLLPSEVDGVNVTFATQLAQEARDAGDVAETVLRRQLAELPNPSELRRFDVFSDTMIEVAALEARSADVFVALRPNSATGESDPLIESVLFGSGRHLLLVPDLEPVGRGFARILVAWDGSREAARALAEAMPYLHQAQSVTVTVVGSASAAEFDALRGAQALTHLEHHGLPAKLLHVERRSGGVGATLIAEAEQQAADLIVMGGYGHSRLREWLLGGATRALLHGSPVPLLISH